MTSPLESAREQRLAVLEAYHRVGRDLPGLLALLFEAEDDEAAVRALRDGYGLTEVQADSVLDLQLRGLNRARRSAVEDQRDELDAVRGAAVAPLDVTARARSSTHVVLTHDGVDHEVEGSEPEHLLERLVELVRERIAGPLAREVRVTIDLPGGPSTILVDPVGSAHFSYPPDRT